MTQFFADLVTYDFLQRALLAGLLAGIATGVVGTYVVVRRITYIAGSIAHCVLGGMGAAQFLHVNHGWTWLTPTHGALAAALLAAMIIGWVSLRVKEREDTVIGALWAIGMALGVIFIHMTQGYGQDLMSLLFGDILLVTSADIQTILVLDALVLGVCILFYNQFLAVCFDEQFARLRAVPVEFYYLLLLCLTALTVVVLVKVVGIIMVIALLTMPAAIAGTLSRSIGTMIILAAVLSAAFTATGLALSYGPDLPAGATIILVAGAAYLLVVTARAVLPGRR